MIKWTGGSTSSKIKVLIKGPNNSEDYHLGQVVPGTLLLNDLRRLGHSLGVVGVVDVLVWADEGGELVGQLRADLGRQHRGILGAVKLVVGWTGSQYHAWINVWSESDGWVEGMIYFNGQNWELMDPTFASSGKQSKKIMDYIGDGKNYKARFLY